ALDGLRPRDRAALEAALPAILRGRRWYGAKSRVLRSARIADVVPIEAGTLLLVRTELASGESETYAMPLAVATGERAHALLRGEPHAVLADVELPGGGEDAVLFDALEEPAFCSAWLEGISRRRRWRGEHGQLSGAATSAWRRLRGEAGEDATPHVLRAEQSNTSMRYGERLVLKLFRKLAEGVNPDLEIGRFLTERTDFAHTAPVAGWLEYRSPRSEPITLGVLQAWVENEGDAWQWTLDNLKRFYEEVLVTRREQGPPLLAPSLLDLCAGPPPPDSVLGTLGGHLEMMRLLGGRTGELHLALASDAEDPAFAPERLTTLYQRSLYQSM